MITHSIEINRPAEEVFAYLDQLERHSEWQSSLVSARVETEGPTRVGTRVVERRRFPAERETFPTRSQSTNRRAGLPSAAPLGRFARSGRSPWSR